MTVNDVMLRVVDALDRAKVPYILVGAFSSNYHGVPRSTEDVDFVIELDKPLTAEFSRLLGDDFEPESQLTFETNTGTYRQEFRVHGTLFKVELFRLSNDPFDQSRFQRRMPVDVRGRRIWFPTAEDVIVMKLRWARNKDKDDVREVMSVQRDNLDWKYIEEWCEKHGSLKLMNSIRQSLPKPD
jgi:predicted nucleotidyltransferase